MAWEDWSPKSFIVSPLTHFLLYVVDSILNINGLFTNYIVFRSLYQVSIAITCRQQ